MTAVVVEKVNPSEGRDGPQWELQVKWPWTNPQYSDKVWIDVASFPNSPAPGQYESVIEKTTIKRKKDTLAPPHDGSQGWMWNYRILELKPASDKLVLATPGQLIDRSQTNRSKEEMRLTECYHMAVNMVCGHVAPDKEDTVEQVIRAWSRWFYIELTSPQFPADAPQQPPEADSGVWSPDAGVTVDSSHMATEPDDNSQYLPGEMCPDHPNSRFDSKGKHPNFVDGADGRPVFSDWHDLNASDGLPF